MSEVSVSNKFLAKFLVAIFGGKPRVFSYLDEKEESSIDILTCEHAPQSHTNSYATLGLSDYFLGEDERGLNFGVELVAAFGADFEESAQILSTAAFCLINSKWKIRPGTVFPDVVSMYRKDTDMKHLLFCPPFLWEDLTTQKLADKTVMWLMAVPISEEESRFAEVSGSQALEDLFAERQIDVFNLNRSSEL